MVLIGCWIGGERGKGTDGRVEGKGVEGKGMRGEDAKGERKRSGKEGDEYLEGKGEGIEGKAGAGRRDLAEITGGKRSLSPAGELELMGIASGDQSPGKTLEGDRYHTPLQMPGWTIIWINGQ